MQVAFAVLVISTLFLAVGLRVFFEAVRKRLQQGKPWLLKDVPELKASDSFPRSLFRMQGMTGGPQPLKAPLSGKPCYYYELIYTPFEPHSSDALWRIKAPTTITLMTGARNFTFFSPKGPLAVSPSQFSRDCMTSMKISHSTRIPLPLEIRQKIQSLKLGEGSLEERILPAHTSIQLVGRAEYKGPAHWRMKKGPGVFPIISSHPEAIQTLGGNPAMALPLTRSLFATLCIGLSLVGFYFFRLVLTQ